jgi:hypothetical protein
MNIAIAAVLFILLTSISSNTQSEINPNYAISLDSFNDTIADNPMNLSRILGKKLSWLGIAWNYVVPLWDFDNNAIGYIVPVRGAQLAQALKQWKPLDGEYCVSLRPDATMLAVYFNHGYVFRIEMRFLPDTFFGVTKAMDANACLDETPLFNLIAKQLGGEIVREGVTLVLKQTKDTYLVELHTEEGRRTATLSWTLRGGPCTANTCPDE